MINEIVLYSIVNIKYQENNVREAIWTSVMK